MALSVAIIAFATTIILSMRVVLELDTSYDRNLCYEVMYSFKSYDISTCYVIYLSRMIYVFKSYNICVYIIPTVSICM